MKCSSKSIFPEVSIRKDEGLETNFYEERMKKLRLFSLENSQLRGTVILDSYTIILIS